MPVETGKTYRVRFQCQGDTFAGRAWEPGDEEPADWFVSATDTLSRPGAAALSQPASPAEMKGFT